MKKIAICLMVAMVCLTATMVKAISSKQDEFITKLTRNVQIELLQLSINDDDVASMVEKCKVATSDEYKKFIRDRVTLFVKKRNIESFTTSETDDDFINMMEYNTLIDGIIEDFRLRFTPH